MFDHLFVFSMLKLKPIAGYPDTVPGFRSPVCKSLNYY